jgi:hypothetical protein
MPCPQGESSMEEKNQNQVIPVKKGGHDIYVIAGIAIYLIGYIFLSFVGNNYTGVMSFLAPAFILGGALVLVLGLIF